MPVSHIDHFTLRVRPSELERLRAFYEAALDLTEGPRPGFSFSGHWLYAGDRAVVHLAGLGTAGQTQADAPTGRLDHIAFSASGLKATRVRLADADIAWREAPVPGMALHQIFVTDPCGLTLELTFDAAELDG